ncbi:MAG: GntR family transcriptional regulator [Planctomycetaceae bacterium]
MLININPSNGLAVYDQIARQIKFAVANKTLRPGELVPSVRELARTLAVNPNTIARAYRELQGDGIVQTVRGTGLEITAEAPELCRSARHELIRLRLREVLEEARRSQLSRAQIKQIVEKELSILEVAEGQS